MKPPIRVSDWLLVVTALVGLSAAYLGSAASARADDGPVETVSGVAAPVPELDPPSGSIKISVNKAGEQPMTPGKVANPLDHAGYGVLPGKIKNNDSDSIESELTIISQPTVSKTYSTYTISVLNTAKVPAQNLEVEYHIYQVIKQSEYYSTLAPEIADSSATKDIAVAPGKATEITVDHIPSVNVSVAFRPSMNWYGWWENTTRVGGKGLVIGAVPKKASDIPVMNLFTNTSFLGWRVIVRHNGVIIAQRDDSSNLDGKLAEIKKERLSQGQINTMLSRVTVRWPWPDLEAPLAPSPKETTPAVAPAPPVTLPPLSSTMSDAYFPPPPKGSINIKVEPTDVTFRLPVIPKDKLMEFFGGEADITYTVTLKNSGQTSVKNLEVTYHFFNLTQSKEPIGPRLDTIPNVTDITATTLVEVAPEKTVAIATSPIPKIVLKHPDPAAFLGTHTDLLGWRVEVSYNHTLIASQAEPSDLSVKLGEINQVLAQQAARGKPSQPVVELASDPPVATDDTSGPPLPKGSIEVRVEETGEKKLTSGARTLFPDLSGDTEVAWEAIAIRSHDITYSIRVGNSAKVTAKNLKVEYHFYLSDQKTLNDVKEPERIIDISNIGVMDIGSAKTLHIAVPTISEVQGEWYDRYTRKYYLEHNLPFPDEPPNHAPERLFQPDDLPYSPRMYCAVKDIFIGYKVEAWYNGELIFNKSDPWDLQSQLDKINAAATDASTTASVPKK